MTIINPAMTPLHAAPAADRSPSPQAGPIPDGLQEYMDRFFPMNKKQALASPPHLDDFYQALRGLPLRRAKPGDSAEFVRQVEAENRRTVYNFANRFDAGSGKPVYPKMITRGLALTLSSQLLEKDGALESGQKATLDKAMQSAFAAVSGMNGMSMGAFYLSMMLDPDGNYTFDDAV